MRLVVPIRSRSGIAAVEMALLAPVLMSFLLGLWEVGRYVMIENTLDNAAREASRLAASGAYFSSNNRTTTLASPSTNTDYEIQKKVLLWLQASGVTTTGATVKVANQGSTSSAKTWNYTYSQTGTGSGSGSDPSAAADELDQLSVTVNLPYQNVSWSPTALFIGSQATMTATASWYSVRNVPLTVTATIPSKPLQSSDPVP
jgi:Flp pilus assembly protein TadG